MTYMVAIFAAQFSSCSRFLKFAYEVIRGYWSKANLSQGLAWFRSELTFDHSVAPDASFSSMRS